MNATSRTEAHEVVEKLPLGVHGMMEFELIALGPLAPLARLIGEPLRDGEAHETYIVGAASAKVINGESLVAL